MSDEITFLVRSDETGGYCAKAVGYGIFTQAETLEDLQLMIRDAIGAYFFDSPDKPTAFVINPDHRPTMA